MLDLLGMRRYIMGRNPTALRCLFMMQAAPTTGLVRRYCLTSSKEATHRRSFPCTTATAVSHKAPNHDGGWRRVEASRSQGRPFSAATVSAIQYSIMVTWSDVSPIAGVTQRCRCRSSVANCVGGGGEADHET